jgi:hypothetical protein
MGTRQDGASRSPTETEILRLCFEVDLVPMPATVAFTAPLRLAVGVEDAA